jgi:peptidoglycan-associated lipoprotein
MVRQLVLGVLVLAMPLTACARRQPPAREPIGPAAAPDTAGEGARREAERERARQDSIARARAAEEAMRSGGADASARARAVLEETVYFDYDEAAIRADAQESLARKVPILRANPVARLRVSGHADERGSVEYNLALGMRRAASAREYLAGFGIPPERFEVVSFGEDRPADSSSGESAWARNRRAEFVVTAGGENLVMPGN